MELHLKATGCHLPYGMHSSSCTQRYLPPDITRQETVTY